jgi:hypothetical protein
MGLIQIDWQIQFHYRMLNNRKGGWGINRLPKKQNNIYNILKANIKKIIEKQKF